MSNKEFPINKLTTLSKIPAIKNTVIYGDHELKLALVLYPIKANTAYINSDTINKVIIDVNSNTANITDKVTPFSIAYTKYSIPNYGW